MNKIITREQKQAPLTHAEMDSNFTSLAGAGNVNFFKDYDLINPIVFENINHSSYFVMVIEGLSVEYDINGGGGTFINASCGFGINPEGGLSPLRVVYDFEGTIEGYPFSYNFSEQKLFLDLSSLEATFTGSIRYFSNAS